MRLQFGLKAARLAVTAAAALLIAACDDAVLNMRDQPRHERYEGSAFFSDGASARPQVPGTVPRDWSEPPPPPEVTMSLLERGQERFNIYCSVCHGADGRGDGMIARRGFPAPPSLHDEAVVALSDEHYVRVITEGLGKMPPYADQVPERDRWAIVAYIRALQVSRRATIDDVPSELRDSLETEEGAP